MTANLSPLSDKGRAAVSLMAGALIGDMAAKRRATAAKPTFDPAGASADITLAQAMLTQAMARQVREDDDQLDRLEQEVDELAVNLLAARAETPDLRAITVGLKISNDLERIGDERIRLNDEPLL